MHSSRMRTACLLPVSPSMHCSQRGIWSQRGCTWSQGVYLVLGECTWSQGVSLVLGVPAHRGVYLVPGGTWSWVGTWSWGVYLVQGVYLVPAGVPGPGGCTWSSGGGCYWSWGVPAQVLPPVNRILDTRF